jgi:hypothetical protein
LAFAFVIIPFSYFYYEEYDENITVKQRIVGGAKYTVFLLLIVVVSATTPHISHISSLRREQLKKQKIKNK